jgi:hypothetical protein
VKTVAALVVAAALVVGAVVLRGRIDDDGAGGAGGRPTVACPPELADACATLDDDFDVRVEEAGETADRLTAAGGERDDEVDVWLAPAPWAGLVEDRRALARREPLVGRPSAVIARSPVAVAAWDDRAEALEDGICEGPITFRCLGNAAERPWASVGGEPPWGQVHVGLTDPHSATGLAVLGGAATGFFGTDDYSSNDFDGEFSAWLGALAARSPEADAGDPVARMLTRGPGEFAALGAAEAGARQAADHEGTRAIYPAPVATADLVAIPVGREGGAEAAAGDVAGDRELRRTLAAAGWRVAGENVASGVGARPALPRGDGLPSGAVLGALLDEWDQVTG